MRRGVACPARGHPPARQAADDQARAPGDHLAPGDSVAHPPQARPGADPRPTALDARKPISASTEANADRWDEAEPVLMRRCSASSRWRSMLECHARTPTIARRRVASSRSARPPTSRRTGSPRSSTTCARTTRPHHFAIYNIATDYERIGKLREAATWYVTLRRYRTGLGRIATRCAPAAELKLRPGTLTVRSVPSRGEGHDRRRAPRSDAVRRPDAQGGGHRVLVENGGEGGARCHDRVWRTARRRARRSRFAGGRRPADRQRRARVRGSQTGSLITIDNVPSGFVPAKLRVAPGTHTVKITQYGFTPYTTTVEVVANQDRRSTRSSSRRGVGSARPDAPVRLRARRCARRRPPRHRRGCSASSAFGSRPTMRLPALAGRELDGGRFPAPAGRSWTPGIAPFIGVGYSFLKGGAAAPSLPAACGSTSSVPSGSRSRLLAETGVRYNAITDTSGGTDGVNPRHLMVPFLASLQLMHRYGSMIRNRKAIVALLTGLNFLNYIDRFIVAAVLPKIQRSSTSTTPRPGCSRRCSCSATS